MEQRYIKLSTYSKKYDVTYKTAWNRFKKGIIKGAFIDDTGHIIRELYLQHSGTVEEPYWVIAQNQNAPSSSKYAEEIKALAVAHPGYSQRKIADEVGCAVGTVSKYYPRGTEHET